MMMKEQSETRNKVGIIAKRRRIMYVIIAIFQRVGATHSMRRTPPMTKVYHDPPGCQVNPDGALATGASATRTPVASSGQHKVCPFCLLLEEPVTWIQVTGRHVDPVGGVLFRHVGFHVVLDDFTEGSMPTVWIVQTSSVAILTICLPSSSCLAGSIVPLN